VLGCNPSSVVIMDEPRLYELPLSDLCLVCEPPYTGGLRIAVVDEVGQHYMFCPEMEVTMWHVPSVAPPLRNVSWYCA